MNRHQGQRPPYRPSNGPNQGQRPPYRPRNVPNQGQPPPYRPSNMPNQGQPPPYPPPRSNLQHRKKIDSFVPSRVNDRGGRKLVIDPCGRGYFLNKKLGQFHWVSQFGSAINVAEHHNATCFIDFSDDDACDPSLYYYSEEAEKQKIMFDVTSMKSNLENDLSILHKELKRFYPKGNVVVKEVQTTPFLVNFEDGRAILDETADIRDCLCVTRLDMKLEHASWSLAFAVFEAHAPCACGLSNHRDIKTPICRRLHCQVATARTYEQLEQLTSPICVPLIEFVVYRHTTKKRGDITAFKALFQGMYDVYAEENMEFNLDAYEKSHALYVHKNLIPFYGRREFQNRTYLVFALYEGTLLDLISSGNIPSDLYSWVRDIVGGLSWLHDRGLCHGCVLPHNIVVKENQVFLHGLSKGGDKVSDVKYFGALLFHLITRGSFFEGSSYIPTEETMQELLKFNLGFEAYDLVTGLISGRLGLSNVLNHPWFWMPYKRLDFLRLVSDLVQAFQTGSNAMGTSSVETPLMGIQEQVFLNFRAPGLSHKFLVTSHSHGVKGYGRKRKVVAILRSCRNAYSHILERKRGSQHVFNNESDDLHNEIVNTYPNLNMLVYNCLPTGIRLRNDFRQFYAPCWF